MAPGHEEIVHISLKIIIHFYTVSTGAVTLIQTSLYKLNLEYTIRFGSRYLINKISVAEQKKT
jgi:hypothetical protein